MYAGEVQSSMTAVQTKCAMTCADIICHSLQLALTCPGEARATGWLLFVLFRGEHGQGFTSRGSFSLYPEWLHYVRQFQSDWQSAEGMRRFVVSRAQRGDYSLSEIQSIFV